MLLERPFFTLKKLTDWNKSEDHLEFALPTELTRLSVLSVFDVFRRLYYGLYIDSANKCTLL